MQSDPDQRPQSLLRTVKPLRSEDILPSDILARQSTINSMLLCSARVGYEINNAADVIPVFGEALLFGSAVHYLCEHHVLDPRNQMRLVKPTAFNAWLEQMLIENYASTLDDIPAVDLKPFRRKVIDAYRRWVIQVYEHAIAPDIQSEQELFIEDGLYLLLGEWNGRRIVAHGTPDFTIRGERMEDTKTTNAAFKWTQGKADSEIQPSLYLAMHNIIHDDNISEFVYRIYDRKAEDWNSLATSRTEGEQEAILLVALEYGKQIASNVFPPTPIIENYGKRVRAWYCSASWCGAWNVCAYKGQLNDKADLQQIAVKGW